MKKMTDYQDANGLVIQKQGDGGDSLNRTSAHYVLGTLLDQSPSLVPIIVNLTDAHGKYRRSNHPGMWYSNYDRTSRDQLIPLLIALGLSTSRRTARHELKLVFKDHLKRLLLFAYNTRRNFQYPTLEEHLAKSTPDVKWNYNWKVPDLTGPEFLALYIRGFELKLLYPLLYFLDIETLVGSFLTKRNLKKDDVINHALVLEFGKVRMDTFVMKLARRITPRALLQSRLDTFFGKENEPPLNELYRNLK